MMNAPGSQIKAAEMSQVFTDILFSTRFVLGTMAYPAQGVSVPETHTEQDPAAFPQHQVSSRSTMSDMFHVRLKKEKPTDAGLAIPY